MTSKRPAGAKALAQSPRFAATRTAFADQGALPAKLRKELWSLLPSKMAAEQRAAYLDAVAEEVSAPRSDVFPISQTAEAVQQLASEAQRLQRSLRLFAPHVLRGSPYFGELVHMRKYAGHLPPSPSRFADLESLLRISFDATAALRAFAEHYLDRVKPTRQTKPEVSVARSLVSRMVWRHNAMFGRVPASTWFVPFVKVACAGLPCGRDLVVEAIREVKATAASRRSEGPA